MTIARHDLAVHFLRCQARPRNRRFLERPSYRFEVFEGLDPVDKAEGIPAAAALYHLTYVIRVY